MENDQLHSLKIDISRNTRLLPYERIGFHKILGILKTENGMKILLGDICKESSVRESAISELRRFNYKEVLAVFINLLNEEISDTEKIYIFDHIEKYGGPENISKIIGFIESNKDNPEAFNLVSCAFNVLKTIGEESKEVLGYLEEIAKDMQCGDGFRTLSIITLSSFKDTFIWEELLREGNEEINYATYKAVSLLCDNLEEKAQEKRTEEDELFTYNPELEDKIILDIRVLLGKMTSRFETYSSRSKIAFINALISSNHREFLIYVMKALTSNDPVLIDLVLDLLLSNIQRIRDPDKLFRNLLTLSADTLTASESIVEIFYGFFGNLKETRNNLILRDKLYNYIVVTLETFFEQYRKDFMVTDVIEKDLPEVFQNVRHFVLENFTPELKKMIVNFLRQSDRSNLHKILKEISEKIPFINEQDINGFNCILEILFEKDEKSREISASRIDDINFEKRYLRERIVRLCKIIGKLKIEDAASPLVIIYNFVKKYTDAIILNTTTYALSMLNYSYMLGELEVMLATGDEADQLRAVQFLSLYSDQRALNIILDFLNDNIEVDSEVIAKLIGLLLRLDISNNVTGTQVLKRIIESNPSQEIKMIAIPCLGKCANEADIDFFNDLFYTQKEKNIKAAIVQAIGFIINSSRDLNKRALIKQYKEYLKEPEIKVRIYSCLILIQLGNKEAYKSIMDMMAIKNKTIQREILSVVGSLASVEFAYFLISLMKDEYAIDNDIIPVLKLLPKEELREIDQFIVNIFRKQEGVDLELSDKPLIDRTTLTVKGLEESIVSILNFEILNFSDFMKNFNIVELTMIYKEVIDIIISEIVDNKGVITRITEGTILSYFHEAKFASNTALNLNKNFREYNKKRLPDKRINISIQIISDNVKIINEEIIFYPEFKIDSLNSLLLQNRIFVDGNTRYLLDKEIHFKMIPDVIFKQDVWSLSYYELISSINFLAISEEILKRLHHEEQEKVEEEIQLEAEIKKRKLETISPSAIRYAQTMDDIGRMLKGDLDDVDKYIQKRTTDGELIKNAHRMLDNVYKRFFVEKSKMFME